LSPYFSAVIEDDTRPLPGALLNEGHAFVFAGEAEDGDRARVGHYRFTPVCWKGGYCSSKHAPGSTTGQSVSKEGSPHHTLSPREQEVIRLVMKGLSTRGIAAVLEISPWTVITHLRRIFSKLNVNSRAEMVACVLKEGALSPSSGSS
jgi:DNA-binding CsgD family transcriptional regulator